MNTERIGQISITNISFFGSQSRLLYS